MLTLTQASRKIAQSLPYAAGLAQHASYVLILADFSVARALFIVLAGPLARSLRRLSSFQPCLAQDASRSRAAS